ncbi:G-protein coupled receptor 35-like [Scyliorhinus canicula]|uniref:G-protein coupled receptor 35-like n=1 Tax=Scyliorhinus canicula TaxID=7830 RepID=UPI0018F6D273|nr:G-protein coupled receptor 35-like [Scyliorhinus canicula]XP_038673356.1 G-protein coupled receptor 35-like [Scyliorhinus canicula]XP_038673357.1 G-protein coupled receptor 35-like [Scyliorhinus canicula]XP_038673359.1 G-protein coupled receptor 35-like [Scyliorhinus canicula]
MNCSCEVHEGVKIFQLVLYIPALIVGLILNVLALQTFCWKLRKWTETTIYMTSLAISDLIVLLILPFTIYSYQKKCVTKALYIFVLIIYRINICMSTLIITCISVDRYIAIKYPFRQKVLRSPMKAAVTSAVIWIFTSLWYISSLNTFRFKYSASNVTNSDIVCTPFDLRKNLIFSIVPSLIVFMVIPLITVTFCSFQIIRTLRRRNMPNAGGFSTERTIRIITINAVVFVVCFLPFNVTTFIHVVMVYVEVDCSVLKLMCIINQVTMCLANMNCCLDGFCFYFVTVEANELSKNQQHQPKDSEYNRDFTLSTL